MADGFEQIKNMWHSFDDSLIVDYSEFQNELTQLRKRRRRSILYWCISVIIFSIFAIGYVIYTDELSSIYKSVSEFIILFTAIYLLMNSWRNIKKQNKEYLLSNIDFLTSVSDLEMKKTLRQIVANCICISFIIVAIILYFLDEFILSRNWLLLSISILLVSLLILWVILKPIYVKRKKNQHEIYLGRAGVILKKINK
ncbi:hypothetical protein [Sphingobacterium kitahiroshimense]|uniref:Uncharacterized protein n=1 Tax=Sphingobacterium kitahiroshimense TaxID=470446 RepID=A0ABV0C367_9SPHI